MPMRPLHVFLAPLALTLAVPAFAAEPANPQIDYPGYTELVLSLDDVREAHRLPTAEFLARAQEDGALLLDARSESAFAAGHIEGAVNLPLPDFTDEALAAALGTDKSRPIYIYCNNNFSDDRYPVVTKRVNLALNIATFINLHGYGYTNVWELGGVLDAAEVPWVEAAGG
jgi:hypothetical protein